MTTIKNVVSRATPAQAMAVISWTGTAAAILLIVALVKAVLQ